MTDATAMKEQLAQMDQAIANLQKIVEDKDLQIAQLTSNQELANVEEPHDSYKHVSFSDHVENEKEVDKVPSMHDSVQKSTHFETSILADIFKAIYQAHQHLEDADGISATETADGKGNPRQHITHFIETYNNTGTSGYLLVKQFVRSLKENAFDWYVDLEPESIDSRDEMEIFFLSRFYSTHRTMSMVELTNTKQWKDELGIKARNFEELATRAHNMEFSIANHKPKFPIGQKNKKSKDEDFSEPTAKELITPVKFSPSERKSESPQNQHTPRYNSWLALDDKDIANTNAASVTPTNDMHVLENKQETLPSLPAFPPKLRLNSFDSVQMEASISDMEPFTKVESYFGDAKLYLNPNEMQEAIHSKLLTSQLIEEVRSKATSSESNAEEFSKLIIDEVPASRNHKSKNLPTPQYFPMWLG
ncbi:UNVERIFIED_CONTAM: hypothetical protein Sradi_0250200 [Sesamum radiatum]|uniref:Retrotransposon gag domain-containing protein n=1 Tax=Sesamum radiatum TaxID=300843 RepID=A0AAW2W203_SESRA